MNQRPIILFAAGFLVVALSAVRAEEPKKESKASSPLARFAALQGDWVGKGIHDGQEIDAVVTYKVTSGGSAVVETIDPGGHHEMITVIHPDGEGLALTHYCMLGNQPHMRAVPKAGENKVAFEFVKASNMKSEKEMHMRNVTFTFVDADTLRTEWINFDQGKEAGKAIFELKRKQ